jgi:hypothetical protein
MSRAANCGIYGKWIRLYVIQDADRHLVSAYVDSRPAVHYFKYGAYGSQDDARTSIVTWRDVRFYGAETLAAVELHPSKASYLHHARC